MEQKSPRIFLDTARLGEIKDAARKGMVSGFTTNPSIMPKDGVLNYVGFVRDVLAITNRPVSFEVFTDEPDEMERQARAISSWGSNVYVKIPVVDSTGKLTIGTMTRLSGWKIKLNVTAIFTVEQLTEASKAIGDKTECILSVFAGRIANTGVSPVSIIAAGKVEVAKHQKQKILWASTREVYNIVQAREGGCDIITMPPEILAKMYLMGKDLTEYSRETAEQFLNDARQTGYTR